MTRQGGIKGWERKEDYSGEKVYYQRYQPEDEIIDPRYRTSSKLKGIIIRGNEDEGYVVIMERKDIRGWQEGEPSPPHDTLEKAEEEAKRIAKKTNEARLFVSNTSLDKVMQIIEDIASDRAEENFMYDDVDYPSDIKKLAEFGKKIQKQTNPGIRGL